jgi:nicotinate-nucleotide adenylyltransferase
VERIGVLGGTFDPPHLGHLALAQAAYRQLALNLVLWVPAGSPPHKGHQTGEEVPTPAHHRLAMTQLAITGHPHFALCRLDLDRPGPHYTADLLALLKAKCGSETSFWFLLGQDSLRDLASWHAPERILSACRLGVYPRPGATIDWSELERAFPAIRERIDWLDGPPLDLASSRIRHLARQGAINRHQVPAAVCDYIETHKFYTSETTRR